jgi:hypothetical protein
MNFCQSTSAETSKTPCDWPRFDERWQASRALRSRIVMGVALQDGRLEPGLDLGIEDGIRFCVDHAECCVPPDVYEKLLAIREDNLDMEMIIVFAPKPLIVRTLAGDAECNRAAFDSSLRCHNIHPIAPELRRGALGSLCEQQV